ncbi:metal-sensitive transcriptional regulator [Enterococcus faecalis]
MKNCEKKIMDRLKRSEGQLRGVQRMITEGKDCADVMMQLSAVRSSIDKAMGLIVAENLRNCFEQPVADNEEQQKKVEQAIAMIMKK